MQSRLWKRFIWKQDLVTAKYRAGSLPLPLKCWYQAFRGMAKRLPGPHSHVCFLLPFCQTVVPPAGPVEDHDRPEAPFEIPRRELHALDILDEESPDDRDLLCLKPVRMG